MASAADPSTIPAQVAQLPPLDPGGSWECIWGPAQTADESNLVYVAAYTMSNGLPPVFAAVVTRGTDVNLQDGLGILEELWEDLDVTSQLPLPWDSNNPARIAGGTVEGLRIIERLTSNGQTLVEYLGRYLSAPQNGYPLLVVTGHSLGGCLSSVMAPWLANALAGQVSPLNIVPATFAAPTAGNAAFASYFQSTFAYSLRIFNSLDIVPCAWAALPSIDDIYTPCGMSVPDAVYALVKGFEDLMGRARVTYVQPATNQMPLAGSCYVTTDWYAEASYQHQSTTYMTLLGGQSVLPAQMTVTRHPASRSRLRQRFGPLASLAQPAR